MGLLYTMLLGSIVSEKHVHNFNIEEKWYQWIWEARGRNGDRPRDTHPTATQWGSQEEGWVCTGQRGGLKIRADLKEVGGVPEVTTCGKNAPSVSPFNEYLMFMFVLSSGLMSSWDLTVIVAIVLPIKFPEVALKCSASWDLDRWSWNVGRVGNRCCDTELHVTGHMPTETPQSLVRGYEVKVEQQMEAQMAWSQ